MGKVKAVPQFSESISSFCKLMENAQRDYAWNYDEVNRMDSQMKCPYCESGTNDFVPMNQTAEYSGIEMSVNRQGMLRVRVLDDYGGFTTQDIVEIRSCPLCGKRFVKG